MNFKSLFQFAHESGEVIQALKYENDLESDISSLALRVVIVAAISLLVLVVAAALTKDRIPKLKMPLFILMATAMAGSVIVLLVGTVYLNLNSESGGPIHWHADFEIWACGNELELRDPTGTLSNKIGTPVLHEHDDQRIHLEGVVVEKSVDASLGKFMYVVGGELSTDTLSVPLNRQSERWFEDHVDGDGPALTNSAYVAPYIEVHDNNEVLAEFTSGQTCGQKEAEVQVFVYHYEPLPEGDVYWQEKLAAPSTYSIFENSNVPSGDCIIMEFAPEKDRTDKLCLQYGLRDVDRCDEFGIEPQDRDFCEIREVSGISESGEVIELDDLSEDQPTEIKPFEFDNNPTQDSEAVDA